MHSSTSGPSETMSSIPERGIGGTRSCGALTWDPAVRESRLCSGPAEAHPLGEAGTPGVGGPPPLSAMAPHRKPIRGCPHPAPYAYTYTLPLTGGFQ